MKTKKQNLTNPFDSTKQGRSKQWFVLAAVFLVLILVLGVLGVGIEVGYSQKIYPGIKIASLDVSGKTKQEVLDQLALIEEKVQADGLIFQAEDKVISVSPIVISSAPDLAKQIVILDLQQTVDQAYGIGRSGNFFKNLGSRISTLVFGQQLEVIYYLDEAELIDHLQASFSKLEKPPVNAALVIKKDQAEVIGEKSGYVFDYAKAAADVKQDIESLNFEKITLNLVFTEPVIKTGQTGSALNSLDKILAIDQIKLTDGNDVWNLEKSQLIDWLEFQMLNDEVVIGLSQEKAAAYLEEIAADINIETNDAKLKFVGERVVEFQPSQDGKELNIEASYNILNAQVMLGDGADLALIIDLTAAKVATGDLNDLGIKELLGRGISNFAGSPKNRLHNIGTGVDSLNGVLIAPGEEFSLIGALGDIDGQNGYLQELVIKGDRTIPEFGGGLCQIGSTTFRAALWSGLPITARRNHSYRVAYYEPAGMDATIYDPAPDMKFLNDTGHHILFIAKVVGDELHFEYYGTPDGRKVTIEPNPPAVYNIVDPGPPRYIETDDLAPGEKKKVESAHPGADTYFKYTIEYPDGRIEEEEFYSHYVPWKETWLVGRQPTTTDETVESAIQN